MTAETRDALIAESKRLIAERAERASPRRAAPANDDAWSHTMPAEVDEGLQARAPEAGSVFASLVSGLWAASDSARRSTVREFKRAG